MNTPGNRRSEGTRELLEAALLEALEDTPLRRVTVQALCGRANIHRSTFYAHYQDVYDLAEKLYTRHNNQLFRLVEETSRWEIPFTPRKMFLAITGYIGDNRRVYRAMLEDASGQEILQSDYTMLEAYANEVMARVAGDISARKKYYFTFFKAGLTQVILLWVKGGCLEPPEEITGVILDMVPAIEIFTG